MVSGSHLNVVLATLINFSVCSFISLPVIADNDEHAAALAEVRKKIERLRHEIDKTQTKHDSVRTELRKVERAISQLHREIKKINEKQRKKNRELKQLYRDRGKLQNELATHRQILTQQIQAAFVIGQQEYLKLLLNQEDPSAIGRTMKYYEYFNRARLTEIEKVRGTLLRLSSVETKIKREKQALLQIEQARKKRRQELQEVSYAHSRVMAKLKKELGTRGEELSQLVENERRLQQLVNQLDDTIPDILTAPGKRTPFAKLRGKLEWPTTGKVRALFGRSRNAGKLKWNGVLIKASEGKDVRAVSHGRVAYADWLRGYGLLLIVDHGDGYMSLYGHNQALYKETGEWIEAGEVIATVGQSGGQQEAALYFEIRHNGKPSNPARWCKRG
jgi:septal ring factor EnvC (AmiA/AmiB activator)